MDYLNALTMEGSLEKQSPSFLKLFQSRYFAVRGKGEYLVWFKKKPTNVDQNPQGIINIDTITDCVSSSDDQKVFFIKYLERKFVLRAETQDLRDRWVNSITVIMEHHKKLKKNQKKNLGSMEQSWKWNSNANKEISDQIRMENEQVIIQEGDINIYQKSQEILVNVLKGKPVLQSQKCVLHSFYKKKGIITDNERWFLIVSGYNLIDENDEEHYKASDKIIETLNTEVKPKEEEEEKKKENSSDEQSQNEENKKAPFKYQINTIYEFDLETLELKHFYPLKNVISWEVQTSESPLELILKYEEVINEEEQQIEEKQIILMNEYLTEIKKWDKALKIIFDKYALARLREIELNKRSKKFHAKKWKYVDEEEWIIPADGKALNILLNKKIIKVNALTILILEIEEQKIQTLTNGEEKLKVFYIATKEIKIHIVFENEEIMKKFEKKLTKTKKKLVSEQKKPEKVLNFVEEKKIDHYTYYIDRKVQENQNSIKVNFYDRMEADVVEEKREKDAFSEKKEGFWSMLTGMFCGQPSSHDTS